MAFDWQDGRRENNLREREALREASAPPGGLPQPRTRRSSESGRHISTGLFVVAVLLFALPWVSCRAEGETVFTVSGFEMVTGKDLDGPGGSERSDPELLAQIALGIAALGVAVGVSPRGAARTPRVVLAMLGVVTLIALQVKVNGDFADAFGESGSAGSVSLDWRFGYWLTLLVFIGIVAHESLSPAKQRADEPAGRTLPPARASPPLSARASPEPVVEPARQRTPSAAQRNADKGEPVPDNAMISAGEMACPNCAEPNPANTRFCGHCASPLLARESDHAPAAETPRCPRCQAVISEGSKFCVKCGTPLAPGAVEARTDKRARLCPTCGVSVGVGLSFCTQCGTALKKQGKVPASPEDQRDCPRCAARMPAAMRFCTECGSALPKVN